MFRQRRVAPGVAVHSNYPHRLSLYTQHPDSEITLDDFEQWAIDRMQVLDRLDALESKAPRDLAREMKQVLQKFLPLSGRKSSEAERRKDHYSHYILRLAFCRSAELRQRFVRLETQLFKVRYELDDLEDRRIFVADLGLSWEKVERHEIQKYAQQLRDVSRHSDLEEYYKVDWWTVPDLVARRAVFVEGGKAYVPESQQLSLLATEYGRILERGLEATARVLPRLDEDQRLIPVLEHLSSGISIGSYNGDASKIDGKFTMRSMDQLDKEGHLPMCESYMHRELKTRHHAHYKARIQYTRFLRHIGMPMEEAVRLWRTLYRKESESKNVDYLVQHQYGAVGGKYDYGPMSCVEIYRENVAEDATHISGCPFHRLRNDDLDKLLKSHGIEDAVELSEIRRLCDQKRYTNACGRVYELTHPNDKTVYPTGIASPNEYFERSWQSSKKKHGAASVET